MMKNWLSRAVCLAAVLFCAAGCTHERIVISEVPVSEGFVGNGVEWSAYPHADSEEAEWGYLMTDEKLRRVFERLDYMKPRIVRIMDVAAWRYYKGVDAQGEPLLDFACDEVRMVCRLLEYCQSRGITVLIGDYGVPGFWGYAGGIDRVDDPRYIDMTTRYLTYLKRERGFDCIRYYIITNEPNGDWACTRGDWEQWKRGIALMHASFERAGLDIGISAPDAVEMSENPASQYPTGREWVEQTVAQMDSLVDQYNIHCYADWAFIRDGSFQRHFEQVARIIRPTGKKMIFGEIGGWYHSGEMGELYRQRVAEKPFASEDSQLFTYDYVYGIDAADVLIQAMKAGWHGASAWMLDDAMHTINDLGARDQLKVWGFWNSLGKELTGDPAEEEIRPWFFTWSLLCRYFPPGMAICNPEKDRPGEGLRIVAGQSAAGTTIVLLNASEQPRTFRLKCAVVGADEMDLYEYMPEGYRTDEKSFPVASGRVVASEIRCGDYLVEMPGRSFRLLTNVNPE